MTILGRVAASPLITGAARVIVKILALAATRILKPPTLYCDVCGNEIQVGVFVDWNGMRRTRLDSLDVLESGPLVTVCSDCAFDIRDATWTAMQNIIAQARRDRVELDQSTVRLERHLQQVWPGARLTNTTPTDHGVTYTITANPTGDAA